MTSEAENPVLDEEAQADKSPSQVILEVVGVVVGLVLMVAMLGGMVLVLGWGAAVLRAHYDSLPSIGWAIWNSITSLLDLFKGWPGV